MEKKTHWKKLFDPNYMGTWDFQPGEEKVLTISKFDKSVLRGHDGESEECTIIHWEENEKPFVLKPGKAESINNALGTPYVEEWIGRKVQLHLKKEKHFGKTMEVIRARPFEPKAKRKLNETEFARMLEAVASGKLSREKAIKDYDLTKAQKAQI